MKTDSNKIIIVLTFLIFMALVTYLGIQNLCINRLYKENQIKSIELSTLKDTVSVYRDKSGELSYKLSVVEVSHSNLKSSLEAAGFEIRKLKDKDISWRKLTNALRMQLAATGTGQSTVIDTFRIEKTDTVYYSKIEPLSNNHLSLFNSKIENSKLFFDYQYQTGISVLQETKRKETIVTIMLTDPNASITTANSITVKQERKWFQKPLLWCVAGFGLGVLVFR